MAEKLVIAHGSIVQTSQELGRRLHHFRFEFSKKTLLTSADTWILLERLVGRLQVYSTSTLTALKGVISGDPPLEFSMSTHTTGLAVALHIIVRLDSS